MVPRQLSLPLVSQRKISHSGDPSSILVRLDFVPHFQWHSAEYYIFHPYLLWTFYAEARDDMQAFASGPCDMLPAVHFTMQAQAGSCKESVKSNSFTQVNLRQAVSATHWGFCSLLFRCPRGKICFQLACLCFICAISSRDNL